MWRQRNSAPPLRKNPHRRQETQTRIHPSNLALLGSHSLEAAAEAEEVAAVAAVAQDDLEAAEVAAAVAKAEEVAAEATQGFRGSS